VVKFFASGLSIGGGLSLGREGPSVQIGGSVASKVAGMLGVAKQNKRSAAAAGAAAGLAAAFNAPLAAVAFVLEEMLEDLNSRLLGPVLLASVIGAFVVHAFLGAQPAFDLPQIGEPTWHAYLIMPFCAALAALVGIFFQRATLDLRAKSRTWTRIKPMWRPLIGGLITWALGMAVYMSSGHLGVFALGYRDLSEALAHGMAWKLALALLVCKLFATIACYGLGGSGGIFSPNLFFGGLCGAVVASVAGHFLPLNDSDKILLAVGGMSACLGAVVQAPVTAMLIIFEMTHQFALVPGLMIAGLVSQLIARWLVHENFYEEILTQDGHEMSRVVPPRDIRGWQKMPISAIAHFDPAVIDKLDDSTLRELLEKNPYRCFPVIQEGKLSGLLMRSEIEAALLEKRVARILPPASVRPGQTIKECQTALIESAAGLVVITEQENGHPLGVVTLHDLLRAQAAISEREG
jgi:CIC family chloride channel protein